MPILQRETMRLAGGLGQLAVPGKAKVETPPLSASPPQQRPPEPGTADSAGPSRAATPLPTLRVEAEAGGSAAAAAAAAGTLMVTKRV